MATTLLVFPVEGKLSTKEELEDEYTYKQTQALVLALENLGLWIDIARTQMGDQPHRCLQSVISWLSDLEVTLDEISEAIEEEDKDLILCRQTAGDEYYDALDDILNENPQIFENIKGMEDGVMDLVENFVDFWIEQIKANGGHLLNVMCGAVGTLDELEKFKRIKSLDLFKK